MTAVTNPRQVACDRRTTRSRKAFQQALAEEILATGDLSRVTVTAVAERSGLTRRTFYTHYRDVPDLVRKTEDELLAGIVESVGVIARSNLNDLHERIAAHEPATGSLELLAYLRENALVFQALMGSGGDPALSAHMEDVARSAIIERVSEGIVLPPEAAPFIDYYVTSAVSSVISVLVRWALNGMKESDDVMARLLTMLAFVRPGDLYGMKLDFDVWGYALALLQAEENASSKSVLKQQEP